MWGMENIFGGYNKEAKDSTSEANNLTGRKAEDVVDNLTERQEQFTSPEGREEKLRAGVEHIMDEFRIPAEQALAEEKFIALKLREQGLVSPQDESMTGYDTILNQYIREIALERMNARQKKQDDRRID